MLKIAALPICSGPFLTNIGCSYIFVLSTVVLLLLSLFFLARTAFCDPGIIPRRECGIEEGFLEPHPNNLSKVFFSKAKLIIEETIAPVHVAPAMRGGYGRNGHCPQFITPPIAASRACFVWRICSAAPYSLLTRRPTSPGNRLGSLRTAPRIAASGAAPPRYAHPSEHD